MLKRVLRMVTGGLLGLGIVASGGWVARGQTVIALPALDLDRYMGAWYEMARLPDKREKHCIGDAVVLYATHYKANRFQMVTSCRIKEANYDSWNAEGRRAKNSGNGHLKVSYFWPFSSKYWVIAVGPDYEWAVVGSPNHKSLWILSRTPTLTPETLAVTQAKAAAAGFPVGKLIPVPQGR